MKKLITAIASAAVLCCAVSAASAMTLEYDGATHEYNGEVYALVVNNQLLDPPLSPIIFNDRALVPVREIFEEVGAQVNYIGETQTIEIINGDSYVSMRINDNVAYINGEKTNIPDNVVPKLITKVGGQTKTMVPVRFISESLGLNVEFDNDYGVIIVDSGDYSLVNEDYAPSVDEIVIEKAPSPCVTYVSADSGDDYVAVTVETDTEITDFSDFTLSDPDRIVVDIPNGQIGDINENIAVNKNGVTSVRLGANDERARIVIDITNPDGYSIEQTSDTELKITVHASEPKAAPTAAPIVTAAPVKTPSPTKSPNAAKAEDKLIVLDAGHGGSDPGATGELDGEEVLEKNLTLQITKKVKAILEKSGYNVSMTRTGDTLPTLVERPTQANEENAAVFVSIHINSVANAPEASGTEVYYAASNNGDEYGATSEELADNILERMLYYMDSVDRGVKTAEHAVTKRCNMPAALVEVGFITNPTEVYNMTSDEYQQKAAQGIAEGIMMTLEDITVPN